MRKTRHIPSWTTIKFYGDSYPCPEQLVNVVQKGDDIVVCDYSEAGIYVYRGLIKRGYYILSPRVKLKDFLERLHPDTKVAGLGLDKWATVIRKNNITTVRELKDYIRTAKRR